MNLVNVSVVAVGVAVLWLCFVLVFVVKFVAVVGIAVSGIAEICVCVLLSYVFLFAPSAVSGKDDMFPLLHWINVWSGSLKYHRHCCRVVACVVIHCPSGCLSFFPFPSELRNLWRADFHVFHAFGPGLGCIGHWCVDVRGFWSLVALWFHAYSVIWSPSAVVMSEIVVA